MKTKSIDSETLNSNKIIPHSFKNINFQNKDIMIDVFSIVKQYGEHLTESSILHEENTVLDLDFNKYGQNVIKQNRQYIDIVNRLDEISKLIQYDIPKKSDLMKSTKEIIKSHIEKTDETKKKITELIRELEKRSTANIFTMISLFGLIISTIFLFSSILVGKIVFESGDFLICTFISLLMLIMARLSKRIYNGTAM